MENSVLSCAVKPQNPRGPPQAYCSIELLPPPHTQMAAGKKGWNAVRGGQAAALLASAILLLCTPLLAKPWPSIVSGFTDDGCRAYEPQPRKAGLLRFCLWVPLLLGWNGADLTQAH